MLHPHVVAERSHAGYARLLLDRLRPERLANRAAWEQMLGRGTA